KTGGSWYYLDGAAGGAMKTGWLKTGGSWYYLDGAAGGAMKTGWLKTGGSWYYLDGAAGGAMKTDWLKTGGSWYYLDGAAGGAMKTGWLNQWGSWYYLDGATGGAMKTGWLNEWGSWYYLDAASGGTMKTGWNKIDTKMNYFKNSGQWVNTRELTVRSTAYSNDPAENGVKPGQHVYTKMGDDLTANPHLKVIAVDPKVIPLGSNVYVEGYGPAGARDTGGAIKGNKIDVFIPSKQDVWNWGVRTVKVYVLP
ncbi:cell surface protein, partial [Bacillus pfraonensis]